MVKSLFRRKSMHASSAESEEGAHQLKRHLRGMQLIAIGMGAIIGAGIFVITGQAAALYAGPAVVLSFIIAAAICTLTGLCYAELSSMIPIAGGSYSYSYAALGELPAWIVGWLVAGQYSISGSTVAVGWSGYLRNLLADFHIHIPAIFAQPPVAYDSELGWHLSGAVLNIPAMALMAFLGILIAIGIRAAAHFNNIMVFIKIATVFIFILMGIPYIHAENWIPFIPENTGIFGEFGTSGVLRAGGLLFFAYVGFDTISTLSQDTIDPQKNIPRGILGSLVICTVIYIITSLVLLGIVHYTSLNVPDPMAVALTMMGTKIYWLNLLIKIAIVLGLTPVAMVQVLGLSRLFLAISKDGLLPKPFSKIHAATKTPIVGTCAVTLWCMIISGLFPVNVLAEFVSMVTLLIFMIVCLGVWILRHTHPEFHRSFKVRFVPLIPIVGILACIGQICMLPPMTWAQVVVWLVIGSLIYFGYGMRHSRLRRT